MDAARSSKARDSLRDAAIRLAAAGYRVFPLKPDSKLPAVKWKEWATTDVAKIEETWGDTPYNIGIATGKGLVVIDVDVKDGTPLGDRLTVLSTLCDEIPLTPTVETPSGGRHFYLSTDQIIGNSASRIAKYVDVRGENGYVVAPGSRVGDKTYRWVGPVDGHRGAKGRAELPTAFVAAVGRRSAVGKITPRREPVDPGIVDDIIANAKAIDYLMKAEPAIQGAGGDNHTIVVANGVLDYVPSVELAWELMLDNWNERCEPPWGPAELKQKVMNAFKSRQNAVGMKAPSLEFEAVEIAEPPKPKPAGIVPGRVSPADLEHIPPRQWLYGSKLSRKYTAFAASPGGVGKTAWVTTVALACASGKKLLHDTPHHAMRVWVYNLEDDVAELRRRFAAASAYHGIEPSALENLRINSGRDRGLKVVKMRNDSLVVQPDVVEVIARMQEEQIELLIVDPFLRSHGVPENNTEAQDEVMRVFAEIADKANAAVLLVHHTKKGATAGDQDSMRGSSTQGGSARSVMMLTPMSTDDAGRLGIGEQHRRLHVRIDDAKNNMAPPAGSAEWIKLVSTSLDNATADYPRGDNVQVARAWDPPTPLEGIDQSAVEACLATILEGLPNGERYTNRTQDHDRWAGKLLMTKLNRSEEQAKAILKDWLNSGQLVLRDYTSEKQRKTRKGLFAQ